MRLKATSARLTGRSIRYHRLHPDYIDKRIEKLKHSYNIRILLVMCDVDDSQETIKWLTKISIVHKLTMMVAWTCVVLCCACCPCL